MKIHVASVVMLVFGLSVGCTKDASDADPQSTTQTAKEPSKESGTPDKTPKVPRIETIDAAGAAKLIAENDEVVILDIRTPSEFQRGHLKDAINIDYTAGDYAETLGGLDKEKTYLMH